MDGIGRAVVGRSRKSCSAFMVNLHSAAVVRSNVYALRAVIPLADVVVGTTATYRSIADLIIGDADKPLTEVLQYVAQMARANAQRPRIVIAYETAIDMVFVQVSF